MTKWKEFLFGNLRQKLLIEGIMPERALLRLKRAGIAVYNVKKTQKTQILLSVKKKDTEKVFAIYPNVCYNISVYTPYVVKKVGSEGLGRLFDGVCKRVGLVLGALLFAALTLFADGFVFAVRFTGTEVYAREAYAALEAGGVKPFSRYRSGKEDWICSQILALDGVEFCSVKKEGLYVLVEIRTSPFAERAERSGEMTAEHTGELVAMTVLRGTPLKEIGAKINAGEALVGNWFSTEDGEQVRVQVIARARIACTYEELVTAEDEESAFAQAYLAIGVADGDEISEKQIEALGDGTYRVKISYVAIETMNF